MNNVFRSVGLMRDLNNMTLIDPNAKEDAQASAEVPKIGSLLALHNWSADFQKPQSKFGRWTKPLVNAVTLEENCFPLATPRAVLPKEPLNVLLKNGGEGG